MKGLAGVLGAVAVLASAAGGEQAPRDLYFACSGSGSIEPARAAAICAEFLTVSKDHSGFALVAAEDGPLTNGPGLEIRVKKASDSVLELEPTWIDPAGIRKTWQSRSVSAMDTNLTERMRRSLYLNVLATRPE